MVSIDLAVGNHTIEWSLNAYETLTAVIDISLTGIVSCVSVIGGTCIESVSVVGSTVTGLLTQIQTAGVCDWIITKGGWNSVVTFDIMDLVQTYLNLKDLGFIVTTSTIMGAVAYYNNQISSGNTLTGCEFT